MKNQVKTVLLLGVLTGLLIFIGGAVGGRGGMILAFILAVVMNFSAYWFSDKIVLKMYRAKEVSPNDAPELHRIVDELVARAELPKPRVYVIPEQSPNAFATGRNPEHAAVAVTSGIMKVLNERELRGVLAHELSHVKHRDTLISAVSATIAGAIMMLVRMAQFAWIFGLGDDDEGGGLLGMLFFIIVGPIAALIIQMAISRSREYYADEEASRISSDPLALASALNQLQTYSKKVPFKRAKETTAHFFIIHPFKGKSLLNLFSTHPPVEKRIEKLKIMART